MKTRIVSLLAITIALLVTSQAEARTRHKHVTHRVSHYRAATIHYATHASLTGGSGCDFSNDGRQQCQIGAPAYAKPAPARRGSVRTAYRGNNESGDSPAASMVSRGYAQGIVGGRPAGCPHAYCGCATSIHVFGKIVPSLNLAANWSRFPSAMPGPGMVAYRSGHVKVITGAGPGGYTCFDPNSGGGLTRSGPCSISGYRVVNPQS